MLGVALGLCCGLPVLAAAGVAVGAVGLILGSALIVAVGVAGVAWSLRRRERASARCRVVPPADGPEVETR